MSSLNRAVQDLKVQAFQETPARIIGTEVRLECHRQRMGKAIGKVGYERIKCGDRAAHRGRPVVDALLCLTGLVRDHDVYADLYGVSPGAMKEWMDVPEMVEMTGFRASLQSEGRLTLEFQAHFERVLEVAAAYPTSIELRAAFKGIKSLQQHHNQLQDYYDKIVAANQRR